MARIKKIARRTFLIGSAAVTGGVVIGYWRYKRPYANPLEARLAEGEVALTPYVKIDQRGVTIITPRAEMGQGVHTTLAALVAEELDVALESVRVEHGPASKAYFNGAVLEEAVPFAQIDRSAMAENARAFTRVPAKFLGMQVTGGSTSMSDAYVKMRQAGAAARAVLVKAAARVHGVEEAQLTTAEGSVVLPDGTAAPYQTLAAAAADIEPPPEPALKPPSQWRLLGRSLPRVDVIAKSTGTAQYAVDVRLPGMLYATVRRSPFLGAGMRSFDAAAAKEMAGVKHIVELADGIVVVATNTWYAMKAAKAVKIEWEAAPYATTTAGLLDEIAGSFNDDRRDSQRRDDGDVDAALLEASVVEAQYRVPFLAHATMEPMNATAWLRDDQVDIWAGSQIPTQVIKEAVELCDLDADQVNVHTTYMGGGFGRRGEMDFVRQTLSVAKALAGTPVKLTWSREEDMTHDMYRPAAIARFRGAVKDGKPTAFDLQLATSSVIASQMGRLGIPVAGADASIVQSAWDQPYDIANYRVTGFRAPASLPVTSWRAVGASQNGFFHESMIDELAHAAERDPLEMRLDLMTHDPGRKVLEAVAEMSGWSSQPLSGHGRGVAFVLSFGVPVAEVVEVANTTEGIRIVGVWAAVDVGTALDPRNIEAQVQSGINFGLSAAMTGEITVADGKVEQTNFHQYDGIRIHQAPPISVEILENGETLRGIGEPGLPPVAAALANAIFAATGQRIRELPLRKQVRFA